MDRTAERITHAQARRALMGDAGLDIGRSRADDRRVDPGAGLALRGIGGGLQAIGGAIEMTGLVTGDIDDHAGRRPGRSTDPAGRLRLGLTIGFDDSRSQNEHWRIVSLSLAFLPGGSALRGQQGGENEGKAGCDKGADTRKGKTRIRTGQWTIPRAGELWPRCLAGIAAPDWVMTRRAPRGPAPLTEGSGRSRASIPVCLCDLAQTGREH
ncbi:hypothetical protein [Sphingobium baderi]|uniref:Uncharacterized protein n=1 Tax=Sphingobium baderi TaxID=1332080 RepID=A0A0S3EZU7_9SPHN|nr:hypothetical protein [Sphingobium baderi]ALR20903.1 hypothetical protein ATN00_11940 [Sphingobium baderi]